MFQYNLFLALKNFKRSPSLYALVCLTLALGIGLLSANLALVNSMMSDPIPHKSEKLLHISMNTWPNDDPHEQPFYILRYQDTARILAMPHGKNHTVSFRSGGYAREISQSVSSRTFMTIRATTEGFFKLTDSPFKYGQGFNSAKGYNVVLSDRANNRLFQGQNSVGETIELSGKQYTIVGVLAPWPLRPRFYHITEQQAFDSVEDIFMPLETAIDENIGVHARSSSTESWDTLADSRTRNVYYLQAWVEINNQSERKDIQNYLDSYTQELKEQGRHPNRILNKLHNVNEWIEQRNITDQRVIAFTLVSFLFLAVCIFNATSLLLSHSHAQKFEHGLRRAIGASRNQLMIQGVIESILLGIITGLVGVILAYLFLQMSINFIPNIRNIAVLDPAVISVGVLLAIIVANLSNLYPLVHTNHRTISTELK